VRVELQAGDLRAVRQLVTGDSHRSQHAGTVHFGLGRQPRVDRVDIRWSNAQTLTLREPAIDRYHDIRPPTQERAD
jgi:hypothetical protein